MPPRTRKRTAVSDNPMPSSAPQNRAAERPRRVTRARAKNTAATTASNQDARQTSNKASRAHSAPKKQTAKPPQAHLEALDETLGPTAQPSESLLTTDMESSEDHISRMLQIDQSVTNSIDQNTDAAAALPNTESTHRDLPFSLPPSSPVLAPYMGISSPTSSHHEGKHNTEPARPPLVALSAGRPHLVSDATDPFGFFAAQQKLQSIRSQQDELLAERLEVEHQLLAAQQESSLGSSDAIAFATPRAPAAAASRQRGTSTSSLPLSPSDEAPEVPSTNEKTRPDDTVGEEGRRSRPTRATSAIKRHTRQRQNDEQENIDQGGRARRARQAGGRRGRGKGAASKSNSKVVSKVQSRGSSSDEDDALLQARERRLQHYKELETYTLEEELVI